MNTKFSKDKMIEAIEYLSSSFSSTMRVDELQVQFNKGYYSGNSKLIDEKNGKAYKLVVTITPEE